MARPYRRRYGVKPTPQPTLFRPGAVPEGEDAPMGPRDSALFKWIAIAVVIVGAALFVLAALD